DRCQECQQPSPAIERAKPVAPPVNTSMASAEAQPVAESFWYAPATSAAPSPNPSSDVVRERTARLRTPSPATTTSVVDKAAGARAGVVPPEAAKTEATLLKRPNGDTVHREKVPKSAFADTRTSPSVTLTRRRFPILPAAAVLVATALGVGVYWLRHRREPGIAHAGAPVALVGKTAATEVPDADDRAVRKNRPATATTAIPDLEPTATASPQTSTSSRPKSTTPKTPSGAAVPAVTGLGGVQNPTREGSAA